MMTENVVQELENLEKMLAPKFDVSDLPFDDDPASELESDSRTDNQGNGESNAQNSVLSVESFIESSRKLSDQKSEQKDSTTTSPDPVNQLEHFNLSNSNGNSKRKRKRPWPNAATKTPIQMLNEMFALSPHEVRFVEDSSYGSGQNGIFRMKCIVRGRPFFGSGSNKQIAKHAAAKAALDQYLLEERRYSGRENPAIGQVPPPSGHRYHVPGAPYFRDYYIGPEPMYGLRPSFPPPPPLPGHGHYPPYPPHYPAGPGPRGYFSDPYYRDPYEYRPPPPHHHPLHSWPPSPGPYGDGYRYAPPAPQRAMDEYSGFSSFAAPGYPEEDFTPPSAKAPPPVNFSDYEPPVKRWEQTPIPQKPCNPGLRFDEDDVEDFVTFDSVNEEESKGDEDINYRKNVLKGKEKILLKVTAIHDQDNDNLVSNHPVSLIHELHPDLTWEFTGTESAGKSITCFKMNLMIHGQVFEGSGKTKKLAKYDAAKNALSDLYNISIPDPPTQAQLKLMSEMLQSDAAAAPANKPPAIRINLIQTDESLLLDQSLANKIGLAVLEKSKEVIDSLTDTKKWNVLAAIVLSRNTDPNFLKVICVTSGTKCVKGDALSLTGSSVNDCHAEILARRCFVSFLYQQLDQFVNCGFKDGPEFVIRRCEDSFGFRLKDEIKVHLFISTAPCGDGRVFSPKEEEPTDTHPNRLSRGVLRAKIEGGEGTIPVRKEGSLLTWDGVLQGQQRMQFMSCSDKICVWNVVGLQGSLLSHFMEPIYLESVVLANLFCLEHLVRAVHGRLNLNFESNSLKSLPPGYEVRKTKVAKASLAAKEVQRQLTKTPNYAVNWIAGDEIPEVISCDSGKLFKEGGISRLSKRVFLDNFRRLLGRNVPTLASCTLSSSIPLVYRDAKTASTDYQRAKTQVIQTFLEQGLGNWIQVPTEIDLFGL